MDSQERQVDWADNHELFRKELAVGLRWQHHVAEALKYTGGGEIEVVEPVVQDISQAGGLLSDKAHLADWWMNSYDLVANGCIVEVKSRWIRFTKPADFPFDDVLVDTVQGYDSKVKKPVVYVHVSQPTGDMIWHSSLSNDKWVQREVHDQKRRITYLAYWLPKDQLREWSDLVGLLKAARVK